MDGLVDMKRTKAEKKKREETYKSPLGGDDYGYGTRVSLDHEDLEKLGISTLPKVGDKFHLHGHAHVTSVSENHEEGGKKRRRMELQLRKMALKHGGSETEQSEATNKGAKAAIDKALGANDNDEDD